MSMSTSVRSRLDVTSQTIVGYISPDPLQPSIVVTLPTPELGFLPLGFISLEDLTSLMYATSDEEVRHSPSSIHLAPHPNVLPRST